MTRAQLPDRRQNVTLKVEHELTSGKSLRVLMTVGFDKHGQVKELFCSDFKEGTDLHTLIMDACMILSLLLQHGYSISQIKNKLVPAPRSLLASLIDAAEKVEEGK